MTQTYLPADLETLMCQAIDQQVEGPKLDFKRELNIKGEDLAELLKDICAIANTDDPAHFHGLGCIVVGVTRDRTFGTLPDDFNADKWSASLNEKINKHISPPLNLRVSGPYEHQNGKFAVVIIPVSEDQPHMIVKESGTARPGQWWVRIGDSTAQAGPDEYARVLGKRVQREVRPLAEQLTLTRGLLENLEGRLERLQTSALQKAHLEVADAPDLSVAAKIRAQYGNRDAPLRQALHREMLRFLEAFEDEFPESRVEQLANDPDGLRQKVLRMEELTRPLGEALATAVLVGGGELDALVGQVLVEITEKTLTFPRYRSLNPTTEKLRSYPQILLVLAVCAASILAERTEWLRSVLRTKHRHFLQNHGTSSMLDPTRALVEWEPILEPLIQESSCSPAYQHINDVVLGESGWLHGADPFKFTPQLIAATELLQSLVYMDEPGELQPSPIPNTIIYNYAADEMLTQVLQRNPALFRAPLQQDLKELLTRYITGVAGYSGGLSGRRFGCRPRVTGALLKIFS